MQNRLSLVISTLALVVALTAGGAYASDVIQGSAIANHTIGIAKLTPKAVSQLHGARGPRGDDGFDGSDGVAGPMGPAGVTGLAGLPGGFDPAKVTYVTGSSVYLGVYPDPSYTQTATAMCPAGSRVVGGGYFASITQPAASMPSGDGSGWVAILQNESSIPITGWAYAACAAR
jgi:hypothetical protein